MRLRRGLQVLNWIWADSFYFVVLKNNIFKLRPLGVRQPFQGSLSKVVLK